MLPKKWAKTLNKLIGFIFLITTLSFTLMIVFLLLDWKINQITIAIEKREKLPMLTDSRLEQQAQSRFTKNEAQTIINFREKEFKLLRDRIKALEEQAMK